MKIAKKILIAIIAIFVIIVLYFVTAPILIATGVCPKYLNFMPGPSYNHEAEQIPVYCALAHPFMEKVW